MPTSAVESSRCLGSNEEGHTHLDEECFRQAIEQHESDGQPYTWLGEVGGKGSAEFLKDGFGAGGAGCQCRFVRGWFGYYEEVIERYQAEQYGGDHHGDGP